MSLTDRLNRRTGNALGATICAGMMGFALYAQHVMGLEPCPLCILERVAVIGTGLLFLLAALHDPGRLGARIYGVLIAVAAFIGAAIATRHVWLQHLPPDQVPACGPGLDYMLEVFPPLEALDMIFSGSGECAEVSWRMLGLSMPSWVLIGCVALGLAGLCGNWLVARRPVTETGLARPV
jgi:disulfide bond formation protein DsbB